MRKTRQLVVERLDSRELLTAALSSAPAWASGDVVGQFDPVSQQQEFRLYRQSEDQSVVWLRNDSNFKARFTMRFNGNISVNIHDLVDQIRQTEFSDDPDMPDYEKAYHYLLRYHEHDFPLSGRTWMHEPSLYLNSIGAGLCDDAASALGLIWKAMGYQSRIWLLRGHVVAEVHTGTRWQMYDPDLRVHYLNQSGEVAGVEELAANPDLIRSPTVRVSSNSFNYGGRMASIYSSTNNNSICKSCTRDTVSRDLVFELPAGGTMEWGEADVDKSLPRVLPEPMGKIGQIKITIPSGSFGSLDIPLALYDVRGESSDFVVMGGRRLRLGTDAVFDHLNGDTRAGNRIASLSFRNNAAPIEVIYFFNRQFAEIQTDNLIQLEQQTSAPATLRAGFQDPLSRAWTFPSVTDGGRGRTFDGTHYIDVTKDVPDSLFEGSSDFEVSASVKIESGVGTRRPVFDVHRFSLEIDEHDRPYAYYRSAEGKWVSVLGPTLSAAEWHDIAVIYQDGTLSLLVNGATVSVRAGSPIDSEYPTYGVLIGKSHHIGGLFFDGVIDRVSVRELVEPDLAPAVQEVRVNVLQSDAPRDISIGSIVDSSGYIGNNDPYFSAAYALLALIRPESRSTFLP